MNTPYSIKMRHESACLNLNFIGNGTAYISGLFSKERNKGHATELMKKACDLADKKQIGLFLDIQRFGAIPGPDNAYLISFYKRFGFVSDSRSPSHMVRPSISSQELRGL